MSITNTSEACAPALDQVLFGREEAGVFVILDGASVPALLKKLYELEPEYCCLYRGELQPDMASVAPYLVRLEPGSEFTGWVLKEGWGQHWGVFILSSATLRELRNHFREFHTVELPDLRTVLFRYYDPRVLRSFLPACNPEEIKLFFGPVSEFLVEADPAVSGIRYRIAASLLKSIPFELKKESGS